MGGGAKTVIVVLVIVAIVIPIALGAVLVKGLPYSLPAATQAATSSSSSPSGTTIIIPQGAGSGSNFSPSALTVASGTTITFVDQDSLAPHNVYFTTLPAGATSPNPAGSPPTLTKGDTYSVTLTTPGTYDYDCQFHSTWMLGVITVTG